MMITLAIISLSNRVLKDENAQSLVRFLMDKCASLHLSLKMFFWFQAGVEDGMFPRARCNQLWNECEMAAVNSKSRSAIRVSTYLRKHGIVQVTPVVSVSPAAVRLLPKDDSSGRLSPNAPLISSSPSSSSSSSSSPSNVSNSLIALAIIGKLLSTVVSENASLLTIDPSGSYH